MLSWRSLFVLGVALTAIPCASNAQDFSVTGSGDIFPSGVGPPAVLIPFGDLGLAGGEELDAVSYGSDMLVAATSANWVHLYYSVDRAAVGIAGPVFTEASGNGAAGDQFDIILGGFGAVIRGPALVEDATQHGLAPLPALDDLDGHSHPPYLGGDVFYSINAAAVATASVRWAMPGLSESDILYVAAPPVAVPAVYANRAVLGLVAGDDIDAVAISDWVSGQPGVLDAGDLVYISLAPGSPTLAANGWSPGDVIQVYPGPMAVIFGSGLLDLAVGDNLNALTGFDPGPQTPAATNWGLLALTVLLLVLATTFILWGRRLFRSPI